MLMWEWCQRARTFWYNCSVLPDRDKNNQNHRSPVCCELDDRYTDPSSSLCSYISSLFIGWRYREANRGHHGLIPCRTYDFPLGPVRVAGQLTLLLFMDGDLKNIQKKIYCVRLGLGFLKF